MDVQQIILSGGSGGLNPALYRADEVAGFGSSIFDVLEEQRMPQTFRFGVPVSHAEIWGEDE